MNNIILCYNHTEVPLNIDRSTTLSTVFTMAQNSLEIEGNSEDYIFFYHVSSPINNMPLSVFMENSLDNRLFLVTRSNFNSLNYYLNNFLPSLVAESAEFTRDAQNIIHHISTLHSFITKFSKDEISANIISIIPFDRFDEFEGDKKVLEIVKWFKEDFFTLVKNVNCHHCGSETKRLNQNGGVSKEEAKNLASYCELHKCTKCGAITRFPRYNDVCKLIETRKGRCGEFSNVFGAILKTLDFDVRLACDLNDYIWVEYWSDEKGKYVHVDPCENIIDAPLTYEKDWGKKETWVIAVGESQCADVTAKYTQNVEDCIHRRSPLCPEEWYAKYIKFKNEEFLNSIEDEDEHKIIIERQQKDSDAMKNVRTETRPEEERARISGNQ